MEPTQKKLWFKAKRYGWGWYPSSWQGFAVLGLYIVGLAVSASFVDYSSPTIPKSFWAYFVYVAVATTFLVIICAVTGEKPGWRWGKKNDKEKK